MADYNENRISCQDKHPNAHIYEMLMSVYIEASKTNSRIVPELKLAMSSLLKYPLPITSGEQCAIIKGFNRNLCNYVDYKLKKRAAKHGEVVELPVFGIFPNHTDYMPVHLNHSANVASSPRGRKRNNSFNSQINEITSNERESVHVLQSMQHKSARKEKKNQVSTIKKKNTKERNNNYSVNVETLTDALHINIENTSEKSLHPSCDSPITDIRDGFSDPSSLLGEWDSIPSKKSLYTQNRKQNYTLRKSNSVDNFRLNFEKPAIYDQCRIRNDLVIKRSLSLQNLKNQNKSCANNSQNIHPMDIDNDSAATGVDFDCPVHNHISKFSTQCSLYCQPNVFSTENHENCNLDSPSSGGYNYISCEKCFNINSKAKAFEAAFKEHMKKDMERISNLILPRKLFIPGYKSPAYAVLAALLEQRNECPYRVSLTRAQLIEKAQKHTDQPFMRPQNNSFHSDWALGQKLVSKGMIEVSKLRVTGEELYTLTAVGRTVARSLIKNTGIHLTVNDVIYGKLPNDRVPSVDDVVLSPPPLIVPPDEGESSDPLFIMMPPGTFEIFLLVDKHEHFKSSRSHKCKNELRSLNIGDFLWVARSKKTGQELVLPYVVERKRIDDLASSIKDGRFHEQKFRLKKSGLDNVIYLIENHAKNKQIGLPLSALKQALANTSVQDKFLVMHSESLDHTYRILGLMSDKIVHKYLPKHLRGSNRFTQGKELMTFEYFNKASSKTKPLSVKETFIKMLLQLKGLSVEKALAITNKYPSPMALMKAYDRCSEKDGEMLLSKLKYNDFSRNIGPVVSKTIYQLFSMKNDG